MHPISFPTPYSAADYEKNAGYWRELASRQQDPALGAWMVNALATTHPAHPLLAVIFSTSPFLSQLSLQYPFILQAYFSQGADTLYARLLGGMGQDIGALSQSEFMARLRTSKGKIALLIAIADIASAWPLEKVTETLSNFAELCLIHTVNVLLAAAAKRGEISLANEQNPSQESGIIILGMGKLGGRELNYSSDIDLIILFEPGRLNYKGRHNEQQFMNKLTHDIVQIMQERTSDGYVFRTDLRLRPDPASTPPAININAAHYYYESVGQNWERAAMIKARPVAGDLAAGSIFIKNLAPFMWRRNLDFAAIQDIHSIKRQMDTHQGKKIRLQGHNIKLGAGGIREIEFYVQIHQLIWGGRTPTLRTRGTLETLAKLSESGLVSVDLRQTLTQAYIYLRTLEHRLQMVADEQTHSLPMDEAGLQRIACFIGYDDTNVFIRDTVRYLDAVHGVFADSFQSSEKLGESGNLVFTGVTHDPDTLNTLRSMGYVNPETVSEIVMGWHHGSKRATRTKRARELLTELMPTLLKRLSETANPDIAFLKFNDFLTNLPAGVQLFSLFNVNPQLLGLVADIMGSAPTLAEYLSKSPALLDAVLYADFYEALPSCTQLRTQLHEIMPTDVDFGGIMDGLMRFRNEKQFQAGVHLLKHKITAPQAGQFLSDLADVIINVTLDAVSNEFTKSHGIITGSSFAIIALGKLGSCEMTFSSDVDLVFVYNAKSESMSDGEKPLNASIYYNRLAGRLLNTLTSMGREGRLYEVDTRLRPSGGQSLLITSLDGLKQYFNESAWTFEFMAFTKARLIAGGRTLQEQTRLLIDQILVTSRDKNKLKQDVIDMRARIEKEFAAQNIWNLKYVRGGLIDLDFVAQYLLLHHAPDIGTTITGSAENIFTWLQQQGKLSGTDATSLLEAGAFLNHLFHMLRLCSNGMLDERTAMPGLKTLLCKALGQHDFDSLRKTLVTVEEIVLLYYKSVFN